MCAQSNQPCSECTQKRRRQLYIFGGVVFVLAAVATYFYFKMNKKLPIPELDA